MCSEPCQWYKGLQSKLQRVKRCLHRITIAFQCQGPICWRQRGSRRSTFENTNSKACSSCRTNFRGQCIFLFLNHAHQNWAPFISFHMFSYLFINREMCFISFHTYIHWALPVMVEFLYFHNSNSYYESYLFISFHTSFHIFSYLFTKNVQNPLTPRGNFLWKIWNLMNGQ